MKTAGASATTGPLTSPRYSYSEAAHLAGIPTTTARRWLRGYEFTSRDGEATRVPPVAASHTDDWVSFLDLIDLAAISKLRSIDFSLQAIRGMVRFCQQELGVDRPLVTLEFKVGGRQIFIEHGLSLLEVGHQKGRQAWSEVLEPFLSNLDYGGKYAQRWWPAGRRSSVVIDPEFGFGLPVVAESGVRTELLHERFSAGEMVEEIADDFNLGADDVQKALQFEALLRAA